MKLYDADLSPNAMRVRAVAYELGIDLEFVQIDPRAGQNKKPEFLALNPNGKVPVLVDGDFALWESRAINNYLAGLRSERGLYPQELITRALVDQWSYWQAIHLGPAMQRLTMERYFKEKFGMGAPDQAVINAESKNLEQFLPVLDRGLAGKEWIVGHLSVADFALASTFPLRSKAGISLDATPNVAAWIQRMEARDSWRKATAPLATL